ncbi:conserved hypothetical protein [Trichormus variabilis ATCC 29413]|uniref:Uncharacterized protein n=2 Tax=Anabaena variabilis TaxID=264691 RepID=Q3MG32_TRIV2|nr:MULTISPECIES: hypothetical protein [Nostocaceae]ABA20054.1 conserved hypothetical protein [Trichormus variabilis ATCC 29413]MBC1215936.1 hypothetical protein [Trichormus variabilis ARAD]MBC1255018.1 hypothetical protein [Trichormus variabilis V5]MBC1266976.1 hypothetical protein [Trichormus variabilis FSR]MBC1303914.1 hypothetical protein [Trichormus variabilis N2B]
MKKSTLTLLCLVWVLIPHGAIAGGSSWEYQVVKFNKTSPTSAQFSLRRTRREPDYPRKECKEIVVRARYRPEAFWRRTWSRFVSRRTQNQALRLLQESFQKKKPIRFGEIGSGLKKVNSKTCVFESRGLDVRQEHPSKQNAVYSYHDPI